MVADHQGSQPQGRMTVSPMEKTGIAPDGIIQLSLAFRGAKTLLSAAELDVFTILAEGSLGLDTLSKRAGVDERGARDFFDALVALLMLERGEDGRYANTPETDLYLDRRKPTYIGAELERYNAYVFPHWNSLTQALRTGKPQSGARATGHYSAAYEDQAVLEVLVKGMTGGTLPVATALAQRFRWGDYKTLIDVGTAEGCLPVQIAQAHPHITGGGFDLPSVRPMFDGYVEKHGLSDRLRFHSGDFLNDPLPRADVVILGRILHNWGLPTKRLLLKSAYEALPAGGAIIVYERLIDRDRRVSASALLASLNMLIMTASGFDFTGADCTGWMDEVGFRDVRVDPLTSEISMVTGLK
jgi:hypothetical protein